MEHIITALSGVDIGYVYLAVLLISFIENIFPPFPSDVIVVFAGSLIGLGTGSGVITVLLATLGSTIGFVVMYRIGDAVGDRVIETGRIRFISIDLVHRVEGWFRKYGYWVVVANRFLAGTRAVVAFGAGLSEMKTAPTITLSAVSALFWNAILVMLGIELGHNWRDITYYLATYSKVVTIVLSVAVTIWLIRMYVVWRRNRNRTNGEGR